MDTKKISEARRQMLVGKAKKLYDEGYTTKEIADELGMSEASVRSIEEIIESAKDNMK